MQNNEVNQEGKIHIKTSSGEVYVNSQTPQDIADARALSKRVAEQVNRLVSGRTADEMKTLSFRYYLGSFLNETLTKEQIPAAVRTVFWKEFSTVIDPDNKIPKPKGKSSSDENKSRHPFFETCYLIATCFTKEEAMSFTWRQLNSLIDRPVVLHQHIIIKWLMDNISSITDDELRETLKALTAYSKDHDLDCFDDETISKKMALFLAIEKNWESCLKKYFKGNEKNLSDARRSQKTKYKRKYIEECLVSTKFKDSGEWPGVCEKAFVKFYVDVGSFQK